MALLGGFAASSSRRPSRRFHSRAEEGSQCTIATPYEAAARRIAPLGFMSLFYCGNYPFGRPGARRYRAALDSRRDGYFYRRFKR